MGKILQCDPEDSYSVFDWRRSYKAWKIEAKFGYMCSYVSPFRNALWVSDDFYERQAKAFKSKMTLFFFLSRK